MSKLQLLNLVKKLERVNSEAKHNGDQFNCRMIARIRRQADEMKG